MKSLIQNNCNNMLNVAGPVNVDRHEITAIQKVTENLPTHNSYRFNLLFKLSLKR